MSKKCEVRTPVISGYRADRIAKGISSFHNILLRTVYNIKKVQIADAGVNNKENT